MTNPFQTDAALAAGAHQAGPTVVIDRVKHYPRPGSNPRFAWTYGYTIICPAIPAGTHNCETISEARRLAFSIADRLSSGDPSTTWGDPVTARAAAGRRRHTATCGCPPCALAGRILVHEQDCSCGTCDHRRTVVLQ